MYLSNHHKQNKELGLFILGNQPVMPGSVGGGVKPTCGLNPSYLADVINSGGIVI